MKNTLFKRNDQEIIKFYNQYISKFNCYSFAMGHTSLKPSNLVSNMGRIFKNSNYYFTEPKDFHLSIIKNGAEYANDIFLEKAIWHNKTDVLSYCHNPLKTPSTKAGFYLTAAFMSFKHKRSKDSLEGYHFYRQFQLKNGNFIWAHKLGKKPIETVNDDGTIISNPLFAKRKRPLFSLSSSEDGKIYRRYNYNVFLGYYYVPNNGLPKLNNNSKSPTKSQNKLQKCKENKLPVPAM